MAIMGQTGSGKTTVANVLLYARGYTLALRTKADTAKIPGARIKRAADFGIRDDVDRYLLTPPHERQDEEIHGALNTVWERSSPRGGWTVYADEMYYIDKYLKTSSKDIVKLLTQGRSKKITVICGMQRPVDVPRFVLSEATHLIAFGGDTRDAKTLSDATTKEFGETILTLKRYEFAWYYRPERAIWTGRVQELLRPKTRVV